MISLPQVMGHLVPAVVAHFYPPLTFAEITHILEDFGIEFKESLLESKMCMTVKKIALEHLQGNVHSCYYD